MLKKLLRKDVYNKIWQSSVKEVAQKYNVDYDDLLKVCHQANVPIPSAQYRIALNNKEDTTKLKIDLPVSENKYLIVKTKKFSSKSLTDKDFLEQQFNFLHDSIKASHKNT